MKNSSHFLSAFCLSIVLLLTTQVLAQENNKTRFKISGLAMTDAGYNFQQLNPDYFDVMRPTQLPAWKNEYGSNGNVFFGVRQSNFGVRSYIPTEQGELMIYFAFDMFGSGTNAGETTFHLTYAWAELGMLGAGRNWSLFCDHDGFPNMIEYWGPAGMASCKNVQLRFIPLQGANRLALSLEQPGASADEGVYANRIELTDVKPHFNIPDFAAEYRMTRNWGYAEIAGVLRKIEWEDLGNEPYDLSGKVWGWGLNLSSQLNIGEKNVLKIQGVTGKGIQNLINDAPTDIGIKNDFSNTNHPVKGVALPVNAFMCYLDHQWSQKFSSTIGYSAVHTGNSDGQSADAFRNGQYASTNLIYCPVKNMKAGIELQWISRENFNDGWSTSATRIQFSLSYSFLQSL